MARVRPKVKRFRAKWGPICGPIVITSSAIEADLGAMSSSSGCVQHRLRAGGRRHAAPPTQTLHEHAITGAVLLSLTEDAAAGGGYKWDGRASQAHVPHSALPAIPLVPRHRNSEATQGMRTAVLWLRIRDVSGFSLRLQTPRKGKQHVTQP